LKLVFFARGELNEPVFFLFGGNSKTIFDLLGVCIKGLELVEIGFSLIHA
jgi:hypothetical protein